MLPEVSIQVLLSNLMLTFGWSWNAPWFSFSKFTKYYEVTFLKFVFVVAFLEVLKHTPNEEDYSAAV